MPPPNATTVKAKPKKTAWPRLQPVAPSAMSLFSVVAVQVAGKGLMVSAGTGRTRQTNIPAIPASEPFRMDSASAFRRPPIICRGNRRRRCLQRNSQRNCKFSHTYPEWEEALLDERKWREFQRLMKDGAYARQHAGYETPRIQGWTQPSLACLHENYATVAELAES